MNVLAIDTSTESMGLALAAQAARYLRVSHEGLKHAQSLAPQLDELLHQGGLAARDLDLIVVASGPGSFTGLRIGLATAKGLARGAGCQLVGIPTLDAMAWPFRTLPMCIVPVIDARKRRLYTALYRAGVRLTELLDETPDDLVRRLAREEAVLLTGPYAAGLRDRISASDRVVLDPEHSLARPHALLELGMRRYREHGPDRNLAPIYLRKSEAESGPEPGASKRDGGSRPESGRPPAAGQ